MLVLWASLQFVCMPGKAQDTSSFKASGKLWGLVFGDFAYKVKGDTVGGLGRGGANQYTGTAVGQSVFQLRRVYLGYDYKLSEKFSTQFLITAEDDSRTGDALANGRFAPYVKLANIRWADIFKGSDLVFGFQATPAFSQTSDKYWSYRSVERTILDIRRTTSADLGISLQGHLPNDKRFTYTLMASNGTGVRGEDDDRKWFWLNFSYKFFKERLLVDWYSDYNRMEYQPGWHHDRNTNKLFIGYSEPKFSFGVESFITTLRGDALATQIGGKIIDTNTTQAFGISVFGHYPIKKDQLELFARYDYYNPSLALENSRYSSVTPLTDEYNPNTVEHFVSAGVDFTPFSTVHIIPNVWYNLYQNAGPQDFGRSNTAADLVFRVTVYYHYGR